jgi:two-component system response regulator HydG
LGSTILISHDGKQPPSLIEKALAGADWRIVSTEAANLRLALRRESPEAVVYFTEGDRRDTAASALETVKVFDDNLPFIAVMQSKGIEDAVAIMKAGAYDYFSLPLDKTRFRNSIAHAVRLYNLTKRVFLLESQVGFKDGFDDIIGSSPGMMEIYNIVKMVAKSNATVLIQGESGTGKELIAKAVHRHSPRANKVFMDINCGAIPAELLENEMFGHERGAYTGADRRYIGTFERADGGTIFLDEISEMIPKLQVKLLRFLQERSFTRVGGNELINVDVRIVAATNRDLAREVEEGRFREDLYYRLNVVPMFIPPLRERKEDIHLLAKYFLQKMSAKNEKIFMDFAPQALEALLSYDWPGNVRELENVIERVVVLHNDTRVKLDHLPPVVRECRGKAETRPSEIVPMEEQKILPLELVERYAIEAALRQCMGNVSEASRKLKIGQATLYRKIKQYGLRVS